MAETVYHAALVGALACCSGTTAPASRPRSPRAAPRLRRHHPQRRRPAHRGGARLPARPPRRLAPVAAFAGGAAVVAAAYAIDFHAQHGEYGFTESGGRFLYARVAPFADCSSVSLPPRAGAPCVPIRRCPLADEQLPVGPPLADRRSAAAADPRLRRVRPARSSASSRSTTAGRSSAASLHYFEPGHRIERQRLPGRPVAVPRRPALWGYPGYRGPIRPRDPGRRARAPAAGHRARRARRPLRGHRPASPPGRRAALHDYQRVGYTWGPLLAACLLLVLAALSPAAARCRLRLDAALLAALTLVALTVPQAALRLQLPLRLRRRAAAPARGRARRHRAALAEERGRRGAPRAHRALHVAADPVVRARDVERRLVRPVQRADRGQVARRPLGDVALRERVDAPVRARRRRIGLRAPPAP